MGVNEDLIKKEEQSLNKKLKESSNLPTQDTDPNVEGEVLADSITTEARKIEEESRLKIQKLIREQVAKELARPRDVRITNSPRVFVKFPDIYKVAGVGKLIEEITKLQTIIQDGPEVQEIAGTVIAKVAFPKVQKVDIDFPQIQKIEGIVKAEVEFPSEYQVVGKVDTDIPQLQLGNRNIVPVSIWDGKRFINPFTGQSVQGGGHQVSVLKDILAQLKTGTIATTATLSGADGAIQDGATPGIEATVFDYTASNPLAVRLTNTDGDYVAAGAGTQYTEGDIDTTPTGTVAVWIDDLGVARVAQKGRPLPISGGIYGNVTVSGTATVSGTMMPHTMGQTILNRLEDIVVSVQLLDNVVAGNEAQVDVLTMPTVTVTATDLDIRNLVFATDKVDVSGSTLGANSGVDIGDVTINNASGASAVNIQDGGNSITIDGSVSITGSVDTELPAAASLADTTANPTTPSVGALTMLYNGTTWDRARGDITNGLDVDITRANPLGIHGNVTVSGIVTVSGGGIYGTVRTEMPLAEVLIDNRLNPTVPSIGTYPHVYDGAGWDRMRGDQTDGLLVNLGTNNDITVTGNVTVVQATGTNLHAVLDANSGVDIGDVTINNASGASAVNIQDGGNSITIDGSVSITGAVDTELPTAAALADGASATPTTPTIGAVPLLMNATTIDRQRAVVNALDSTGTGIAAAGLVGQLDDVSTGAVTENQFAPVRISSRRAILIEGVASGTNVNVIAAANSGVDIGDVTINNASGASAVNIQDGGNSITVDNGGTFVVQENGAALTSLQLIDDTVYVDGATSVTEKGLLTVWLDDLHTMRAVQTGRPLPVIGGIHGNVTISGTTTVSGIGISAVRIATPQGNSAMDDSNNAVRVNVVAGGAGDGAILDGVSSSIKATVFDFANSNPLAVVLRDTAGDYVSVGGGTQYADGATSPTPTGNLTVWLDDLGTLRAAQRGRPLPIIGGIHGNVTVSGTTTVSGTYIPHTMGQTMLNRLEDIVVSVQLLDNAIAGNEQQVDVITMPTVTVTATDLDIRNLVFATDKVDISGSTLAANSGVDIGDVTINNASGASAVNIQDGGNSITVDGTVTVTDGLNIEGDIAHAGGDSGNPVKIGGKAYATPPAPVSDTQRVNAYFDQAGRLQVESQAVSRSDIVAGSGNVPLAILRQPINVSATGATLISGMANRKIRVLNGLLMAASATTVQFKSANNSDASGPLALGANGGFQIPEAEVGNFESQTGEALTVVLSAANQVGGWLTYVYV